MLSWLCFEGEDENEDSITGVWGARREDGVLCCGRVASESTPVDFLTKKRFMMLIDLIDYKAYLGF
jgi:hypothetical protein